MSEEEIGAIKFHSDDGHVAANVIKFLRTTPEAKLPAQGNDHAVGWDVYYSGPDTRIFPNTVRPLETGLKMEIPPHLWIKVESRSGLAAKHGLFLGCGVIDPDYRGELKIVLINGGPEPVEIKQGDRIAQLVPMLKLNMVVQEVKELSDTVRGEGGFGSTGSSALPA